MASFGSRYDPKRLFIDTYGSAYYLPKINLLGQLSLDFEKLKSKYRDMRDDKSGTGAELEYADYKIKVPVPPPPGEAMRNPRTKQRFPLGVQTDPSTGEELEEIESELEERSIRNQIIYTDADTGTVYFVDKAGVLMTRHIGQAQNLTENRNLILSILDTKVSPPSTFTSSSGVRHKWDKAGLEKLFFVEKEDGSPQAKAQKERLQAMSNVDTSKGGVPLFMYSKNRDFKLWVESELLKFESNVSSGRVPVVGRRSSSNVQLNAYYASLIVATLFAEEHSDMFAEQISEEESSMSVDPADAPEIPHIREGTRFLPHQSYVLSFLKSKKTAMVDADPGAGKTLMLLADVLDKMNQGAVRLPCIVMPNSLLGQQKRELAEWTKGTVNFIILNTQTVKRKDPEAVSKRTGLPKKSGGKHLRGLMEMAKTIRNAPPNTILVTSYDWIRGNSEDQVQKESGISFRRANWLIARGVDMLVLDESHNVRMGSSGKPSKKAQAIMQMASMVSYKRCYTGTSAPSGPDDIFMQMQFLDPSILGNRERFKEKYALSTDKSKGKERIEEFKPGAIKEIRSVISKRGGLSIRRSAWMGKLPQLSVEYHKAQLTLPQRVVYERLMDRIIKEELGEIDPGHFGSELQKDLTDPSRILGDAEMMKKLKDSGVDMDDVAGQLRSKFALNPGARAQVSQWTGPLKASLVRYDDAEDEFVEDEFTLADDDKVEAFKAQKKRAMNGWEKFQQMDDVVGEQDFLPLLQKFIAVDKFLNNPVSDEFGQAFLYEEDDKISPKVKVIDSLLEGHFSNPANGKVIIFTQYKDVAGHILQHMKRSSQAVYYDASQPKSLASFKRDDDVQIMVAVEQSIREGQNLQMANRIIRVDMPWNPGAYEQAIARAYRLPPKDPNAQRYSVVHIDMVLTDRTAEVTKFMRMVSKMHKVRQLVSGFVADRSFPLVGMNLDNMQTLNSFDHMQTYVDVYGKIRDQELEEAKEAPDTFGTESYELASGKQLEGSERMETGPVDDDDDRSPWSIDPKKYDSSVLVNPKLLYFNGGIWLALGYAPNRDNLLRGFQFETNTNFMYHGFSSAEEAIDLLRKMQSNEQFPLRIVNAQQLLPKLFGKAPVDPTFPESTINYSQLVKSAATAPTDFKPTNSQYSKDILGYTPSQQDRQVTMSLLQLVSKQSGGKPVTPLHALSAAKIFGFFNLDAKDLDPRWLWKQSRHFAMIRAHRDILRQQMEQAHVPDTPGGPGAEVTQEPEDSAIPGLNAPVTAEGVPIQLNVSLLGAIRADKVIQQPCFTIQDMSSLTVPGLADKVLAVLQQHGFRTWRSSQTWVLLGESRDEVKKNLKKFAKRMDYWGHYLEDPDAFSAEVEKFGLRLEDLWPKKSLTASQKVASILDEFPEYRDVVLSVFGDNYIW